MRKLLLALCFMVSQVAYGDDMSDKWDELIDVVNALPDHRVTSHRLYSEMKGYQEQQLTEQAALDALNKQVDAAQQQADELASAAAIAAQTSDVMLRGKMNDIINNTDISFSVLWPDGTRTKVAAQSTVSLNKAFSQYKEGSLIGGIISIIPQVNDADITLSSTEVNSVGLSYSLLFNLQGLNEAGFAYGALNYLSVTRQYGVTRAHSIYLDSSTDKVDGDIDDGLIQDNELWAIDVTINATGIAGLIYPHFSTLYTYEFDASDTSVTPDVSTQETWSKTVVLGISDSAANLSAPEFTDIIWSDITVASA